MWIYVIPLHEFVRWRCVFSKGRALNPLLRFVSIVKEGETTGLEGAEHDGHLVLNVTLRIPDVSIEAILYHRYLEQ